MTHSCHHEKLIVYNRALAFAGEAYRLAQGWDARHAIKNQLTRAAESIVENIASATVAPPSSKSNQLSYSLGSALECAACIDIARLKGLMDDDSVAKSKQELLEIFKMLFGLNRSWSEYVVREDGKDYAAGSSHIILVGFHHENLDVYRASLDMVNWIWVETDSLDLPGKTFRILDSHATSIVLNIAEGNGRFAKSDQQRFVQIAHQSSIKLAVHLDLCVARGIADASRFGKGKELLSRVVGLIVLMKKGIGMQRPESNGC